MIESPCEVPAGGELATATNKWLEQLSLHTTLAVCAGSDSLGATGVLVFQSSYGLNGPANWFPAPNTSGAIRVRGAVGEIVELVTVDGSTVYFDANRKAYVPGFPSVTPTPRPGFPGGR